MTTRQSRILKIIDEWAEGWRDVESLEKDFEKLFTDKQKKCNK